MRNFRFLFICGLCVTMVSCNLLSPKNLSNDFRWKNKKFSQPYSMIMEYNPSIITTIPKSPWFYEPSDSTDTDKKYKIRELLEKKFSKRNIIFDDNSPVKLRIEKLIFKEYPEDVPVYNADDEYLGEFEKDFFIFEITGSLIKNDSVLQQITTEHQYSNEPRESYVFNDMIVMEGGNARADKMIENSISEFSYRVYQSISEKVDNTEK